MGGIQLFSLKETPQTTIDSRGLNRFKTRVMYSTNTPAQTQLRECKRKIDEFTFCERLTVFAQPGKEKWSKG